MAVAILMDQPDIACQKKEIEEVVDKLLGKFKFKNGDSRYEFLWIPRYSPEFNPCERAWAMLKGYCKAWCQHNIKSLVAVGGIIDSGVARIKSHHIVGFIGLARRWAEHYASGLVGLPPSRIKLIGYDKMVQLGIYDKEDMRRIKEEDKRSLDATPKWVNDNAAKLKAEAAKAPKLKGKAKEQAALAKAKAVQASAAAYVAAVAASSASAVAADGGKGKRKRRG